MENATISRRNLLRTLSVAGASTILPMSSARGSSRIAPNQRKIIFLRVPGGWDTTRVFAPMFQYSDIDMENEAYLESIGDLSYVAHPNRPNVSTFFQRYGTKTTILNGLIVPSINHMICNRLLYTANSSGNEPDWATRIAADTVNDYSLPHVLISGKALGGLDNNLIVRVGENGQLEQLLSGRLLEYSDRRVQIPSNREQSLVQDYLHQRVLELHTGASANKKAFFAQYSDSLSRSQIMTNQSDDIAWNTNGSEQSQIDLAIDLLLSNLTRTITMEFYRMSFDSHENNDEKQSDNFEDLFAFINTLVFQLFSTPGLYGGTLLDETCVVVLSEMGRTPHQNSSKGKEHWYHTSSMFIGSGVQGGRVFGDFSSYFYGEPIDLQTGEVFAGGVDITPKVLGATILSLAGVDSQKVIGEDPILGMLED